MPLALRFMGLSAFDALTLALGRTTSRREALRVLAGAAGTSVLAFIGFGCKGDANEPEKPTDACPTPSKCGERHYCDAAQTCICIKSAEGYNRCGKLPSTCHVQLCQKSSDCAGLGEGYFCDTPNSGCCTDPPAELPRCIAPCGDADNNPSTVCDGDPLTAASLAAAATAVAGGATDVNLSAGGCFRYRRTISGGRVVFEEVTANGKRVLRWDHSATGSTGVRDSDLDGFSEWVATVTRNAAGEIQRVQVIDYDPATRTPAERRTQTVTGTNTMRVLVEAAQSGGALTKVTEYTVPRLQESDPGLPGPAIPVVAALAAMQGTAGPCGVVPDASCPPGLKSAAEDVLRQVAADGGKCLAGHGLAAEAGAMAINFTKADIVCASSLPTASGPAAVCFPPDPGGRFPIYINPTSFPADAAARRSVLFHEMLHTVLPEDHDPAYDDAPQDIRRENDRVRACNSMCFNPNATKCDCAKCLKKSKCEPPCTSYKDCATKSGAGLCLCPTANPKFYPKFSDCQAGCPKGLACFGFQCRPVENPCMG